jgi:LPXTG-motif cell wall-anchored protein
MHPAFRKLHRKLSPYLFALVAVNAVTGVAFRAGKKWFGISEDTARLLMTIHEGAWLGRGPKVYYSVVLGGGLLALGFFGLALRRRKRH